MTHEREDGHHRAADVLAELVRARNALDGAARAAVHAEGLGRPFVSAVAEMTARVIDLEQNVWDSDPSTVPDDMLPPTTADFGPIIEWLKSDDQRLCDGAAMNARRNLPRTLRHIFGAIADPVERVRWLDAWWAACPRPYVSHDRLFDDLESPRRWKRYAAAKALNAAGVPGLWDESVQEVDARAVEQWYAWVSRSARS